MSDIAGDHYGPVAERLLILAATATPGPWKAVRDPDYLVGYAQGPSPRDDSGFSEEPMGRVAPGYGGRVFPWDARFIAACREDAPALAQEVLRLTDRLAAVERLHQRCEIPYGDDADDGCTECGALSEWPCETIAALRGES